jgi:hypothetical protein
LVLALKKSQQTLNSALRAAICAVFTRMMMKTKSVPASEHRARLLLSTWNSGDVRRLREILTEAWFCGEPAAWSISGEEERERMEILVTIAETMRNWLRRGGEAPADDLQVSMRLLRHLAGYEAMWRESRS